MKARRRPKVLLVLVLVAAGLMVTLAALLRLHQTAYYLVKFEVTSSIEDKALAARHLLALWPSVGLERAWKVVELKAGEMSEDHERRSKAGEKLLLPLPPAESLLGLCVDPGLHDEGSVQKIAALADTLEEREACRCLAVLSYLRPRFDSAELILARHLLEGRSPSLRQAAACAMGRVSVRTSQGADAVLSALVQGEGEVCSHLGGALARYFARRRPDDLPLSRERAMGDYVEAAFLRTAETTIPRLTDLDTRCWEELLGLLTPMCDGNEIATSLVIAAAKSDRAGVRFRVAQILESLLARGGIGSAADTVREVLKELGEDEDEGVKWTARFALIEADRKVSPETESVKRNPPLRVPRGLNSE